MLRAMVDYELLLKLSPPTINDYFMAFATLALLVAILVFLVKIYGILEDRYSSHKMKLLQIEVQANGIKKRKRPWDLTLYETYQIIINCARKNLYR